MQQGGFIWGKGGGIALVAVLALAGCAAAPPKLDGGARAPRVAVVDGYQGSFLPSGELAVTRTAAPFAYSDGAEAHRAAKALCGGAVASGPADNFRDGRWVFPGGCAAAFKPDFTARPTAPKPSDG